jgi:UDP-N-acetylmuramyl-tripeptide synthetase
MNGTEFWKESLIERQPIALRRLLADAGIVDADIYGNPEVMVTGVSVNARQTARNEMFVALTGTAVDSHMLLGEAVDAGASVLLTERESAPYPGVTTVRIPSTRQSLGYIAHAYYRFPARAMRVTGVTGTNGKTSTTHILAHLLRSAGHRVGLIGTLGAEMGDGYVDFGVTTPGPVDLARLFHTMDKRRVDSVVMEVSSHAIDQGRINGIRFRGAALTNVTHDHLDYHKTFENYMMCKRRLFTDYVARTPGSMALFNADDPVGEELCDSYAGDHMAYSTAEGARTPVALRNVTALPHESRFTLIIEGREADVCTPLVGAFNLSNMLAAAGCAWSMGMEVEAIAAALGTMRQVPGRFEFVNVGQPFSVVVDYAHTPDALERVLRTARRYATGRLICVFGCGGDRDRSKRPRMGRIAGDLCDYIVVTNDNPRNEDPMGIARGIVEGILDSSLKANRYVIEYDRRIAIERAVALAAPGDVVVIAGKGHEPYQEISGHRFHFDDREVARAVLADQYGQDPETPAPTPNMESVAS